MNKVQITIEQISKKGITNLVANPLELDTNNISDVANIVVKNILNTHANLVNLGGKINGFSFARKFDVMIKINDLDKVSLSTVYGMHSNIVDARLTLQYNEKSYKNFEAKVTSMIFCAMTGANELLNVSDDTSSEFILDEFTPTQKVIENTTELVEA